LNKLLVGTLLAFASIGSYADDLKVADDFKSGDLVSADTFNQIFDTIEKINRTVVDSDLVGVWSCDAMTTRNTNGWTSKSLFYILENSQVNLTASSSATSLESAYTISTSSPSPFKRTLASAFSGTYILYNNKLFTKQADESEARIWDVNIISSTRFELTFLETSAQSFPTNYASFITCDSAEAVPASPTAPTATNNKTGINLAWTDSSSDETGFKVYRKLSTETEAKVIATQTAVTYSDTDLTEGQTAYYQVTAYNDNGDSAKSKVVSATLDSTAPTVVSTTPENNGTGSRQLRSVVVTFSEKVEIFCPAGDQYTDMNCPSSGNAISFTALVEGSSRTVSTKSITSGHGGSTTLSMTTMGSAERFDANQSGITVTVNKDWIRDANRVQLAEDFQFNFNVDASLDNPSCPPSC
jgi:hypothetical protein